MGPLRHVWGHTYLRTTMIHAFLQCPSNVDVHPRTRFSIFQKKKFAGIGVQNYTIRLCQAHEGVHCAAGKLLTLQQFMYFWKAQPTQMCIPGSILLFLAKMVEIDIAAVGTLYPASQSSGQNDVSAVNNSTCTFFGVSLVWAIFCKCTS